MRIVTPSEVAVQTRTIPGRAGGREVRPFRERFPRDRSVGLREKLTTRALDELVRGRLTYKLVRRRRQEG